MLICAFFLKNKILYHRLFWGLCSVRSLRLVVLQSFLDALLSYVTEGPTCTVALACWSVGVPYARFTFYSHSRRHNRFGAFFCQKIFCGQRRGGEIIDKHLLPTLLVHNEPKPATAQAHPPPHGSGSTGTHLQTHSRPSRHPSKALAGLPLPPPPQEPVA